MSDYAVKVTVRNGRILRLMKERGIRTQAELARLAGLRLQRVNELIGLRKAPENINGSWSHGIENIAAVLHCDPEDLFSEQQRTLALPKNSHEIYLDETQIASLSYTNFEESQMAKIEVERLLANIQSERGREVVEYRLNGYTYDDIANTIDLSIERVRQIEQREYRKIRAKAGRRNG
jgi:DNA-directed RNA polymerase sigma subunit (sigma70/sigma32)